MERCDQDAAEDYSGVEHGRDCAAKELWSFGIFSDVVSTTEDIIERHRPAGENGNRRASQ